MNYRKIIIVLGIIVIILLGILIKVNAQSTDGEKLTEQIKILTEMCVDIKYIKANIIDIQQDTRILGTQVIVLGTRVTKVEERQLEVKKDLMDLGTRNNFFLGFVGSLMLLMLGLQFKRNANHRGDNGK